MFADLFRGIFCLAIMRRAKSLTPSLDGYYRFRIGKWRILFTPEKEAEVAGSPRRSPQRWLSAPRWPGYAVEGFAVAVFLLHFVANEDWWRRGESNPRPKIIHLSIYIHSPIIEFRFAVPNRAISPQN